MKRVLVLTAFALGSAGLVCAQSPRTADEAAIHAQLAAYAAARQTGDGHIQALFYTDDADEWGSGAREMTKGRAAIARVLTSPPDPKRQFRIEPAQYTFLGKDVALVDALYYGSAPEPYGHALYAMVKRDGKWLIRSARMTRFPPPAAK